MVFHEDVCVQHNKSIGHFLLRNQQGIEQGPFLVVGIFQNINALCMQVVLTISRDECDVREVGVAEALNLVIDKGFATNFQHGLGLAIQNFLEDGVFPGGRNDHRNIAGLFILLVFFLDVQKSYGFKNLPDRSA